MVVFRATDVAQVSAMTEGRRTMYRGGQLASCWEDGKWSQDPRRNDGTWLLRYPGPSMASPRSPGVDAGGAAPVR